MLAFGTHAQIFEKYRFGFGGGFAVPTGESSRFGVLAYIDSSYPVNNALRLGVRAEWILMSLGLPDGRKYGTPMRAGYTANAKYYLNTGDHRFFCGGGLGFYRLGPVRYIDETSGGLLGYDKVAITLAETRFGFYPSIGFENRTLAISLDYNFIPSTAVTEPGNNARIKNGFFGIHVGALLRAHKPGGSKKV